jgi:hypothetical protein
LPRPSPRQSRASKQASCSVGPRSDGQRQSAAGWQAFPGGTGNQSQFGTTKSGKKWADNAGWDAHDDRGPLRAAASMEAQRNETNSWCLWSWSIGAGGDASRIAISPANCRGGAAAKVPRRRKRYRRRLTPSGAQFESTSASHVSGAWPWGVDVKFQLFATRRARGIWEYGMPTKGQSQF